MIGVHEVDGDAEIPEIVIVGQGKIHLVVSCTYILIGEERCITFVCVVNKIVHLGDGSTCVVFGEMMVGVEEVEHFVKSRLHFLVCHSARVVADA